MIYNQGFEVEINHRRYFAFSAYKELNKSVTSYCARTLAGWAHEDGINPSDWSCYFGEKITKKVASSKVNFKKESPNDKTYKKHLNFIEKLNSVQSSWKAAHYEFMNDMPVADLVRMAGGTKSVILSKPKSAPIDEKTRLLAKALPESFDWRNVSSMSFVSPIRNQGSCGSCYAFASMAMNEARLRIQSMNAVKKVFSPQDIVECSQYSQGCDGGFPYLIGGKYAEDFGLVEESCNAYTGVDGKCRTDKSCSRQYATKYSYVGGFYGACNSDLMKLELHNNGPIVVGFNVEDDFFNYKGGIYFHTSMKDPLNYGFEPFELTNHAVLIVGYGKEPKTGELFWIVKNSWGTTWGEDGYFRIRRGTDECGIESLAMASQIAL